MQTRRYLSYWGKARPYWVWRQLWHPAAYHCLDVAAIGARLLAQKPLVLERTSGRLGIPWTDFAAGVTQLLAIHDLAKVSDAFQLPLPEAYDGLGNLAALTSGGKPHHTHLLQALLREGRGPLNPISWPIFHAWDKAIALDVLRAITGHHGQPPLESGGGIRQPGGVDYEDLRADDRFVSPGVRRDIEELLADIQDVIPSPPWPSVSEEQAALLSLTLSGFAVQCDWLGSSKAWFPYEAPTLPLDRYWDAVALPRAQRAVAESGLGRVLPIKETGLAVAFPAITSPRPMQAVADALALPEGQCLVVVEDVTGSGKTEAAIVMAHRMISAGKGDGIFFGLPTMATSNAMYRRVTRLAGHLYPEQGKPDIVLSHGGSTRKRRIELDHRLGQGEQEGLDDEVAGYMETWAASDRRSALLCDFGVGTIDQAILAILASKHQSLRLHGLAGKILVVDEAHSYDAYVFEELLGLLRFHAFLGGSAVVMSATLSLSAREAMLRAFREGARWDGARPRARIKAIAVGQGEGSGPPDESYPAVHVMGRSHKETVPVEAFGPLSRFVEVTSVTTWNEGMERAQECIRNGGCACVIRSTVDEAIATHALLCGMGLKPVFLHARFLPGDRAIIENRIIDRFGPEAPWERRAGGLVVATQVIEQSLDLDFDLLITDLAPIELLIQRSGRIARHVEARERHGCKSDRPPMVVVTPDPDNVTGPRWLESAIPGAAAVYRDHGALWRAARALKRDGGFRVPGQVRRLIEECSAGDEVPEALARNTWEAVSDAMSMSGVARYATLSYLDGYRASGPWLDDVRVQTRVGGNRRPVRLGVLQGRKTVPMGMEGNWPEATLDVSALKVSASHNRPEVRSAAEDAVARWPRHEHQIPLIVMEPSGEGRWRGAVLDAKGEPHPIHYNREIGLAWEEPGP